MQGESQNDKKLECEKYRQNARSTVTKRLILDF